MKPLFLVGVLPQARDSPGLEISLTERYGAVNQYLVLETAVYPFDDTSNYVVATTRGAAIEVTLNNGTVVCNVAK